MCLRHLLLSLVIGAAITYSLALVEKVKISVYYETHCPCSISFIRKQLYPTYWLLQDRVDLELIPYGNTLRISENGTTEFQCKKGCYALKVHACALAEQNHMNTTLQFIHCLVDGQYSFNEVNTCAANFSVSSKNIQNCATSSLSDALLDRYGNSTTQDVQAVHIPAISFNHEYDDIISQKARENLLETTCSIFAVDVPLVCSNFGDQTGNNLK